MSESVTHGGVPVATSPLATGNLVSKAGQLQYGQALLGAGSSAGWLELNGWRGLPGAQVADSPRPQAHGTYAGDVWGDSLVVTFRYLLRGTPEAKVQALDALELHMPMDGVDRPLVVDDGTGPWLRMARIIARDVPQDVHFQHGPVECAVQFLCADPRRYSLTERTADLTLPESSGGVEYPVVYPLEYGTFSAGSLSALNLGSIATPLVATFHGPLEDPLLTTEDWQLGFNLNLAEGESLVVDTADGTALLDGTTDRLYTITNRSAPIERCVLKPGKTDLALTAPAGHGRLAVTWRDARM